jgi:RNA-directed DNA polymerase
MKESHGEGLANHTDPESCGCRREAAVEALTGAHADQPLSCEIKESGTPTLSSQAEGNTECGVNRESHLGPAQSKTLCMRGNSLHGNREISSVPCSDSGQGRSEKAVGRTSEVYADEKSDGPIVPMKPPNNDGEIPSAEAVEERGSTKGNAKETAVDRTQSRSTTLIGLGGVREVVRFYAIHPR